MMVLYPMRETIPLSQIINTRTVSCSVFYLMLLLSLLQRISSTGLTENIESFYKIQPLAVPVLVSEGMVVMIQYNQNILLLLTIFTHFILAVFAFDQSNPFILGSNV